MVLPLAELARHEVLLDEARTMGTLVVAPRGAGKSRLLGRLLCWQDFVRGIPTILIDPTGGAIAEFMDQLMWVPHPEQKRLWERVRYLDVSGKDGYILPMPILKDGGEASLYERAQRFPDIVRRLDANLSQAPLGGMNALIKLASAVGIVLGALDMELTEASQLIEHPEQFQAFRTDPRLVTPATIKSRNYLFEEFRKLRVTDRRFYSQALLAKLLPIDWDLPSRAFYGAPTPGVTWQEIADQRLILLIDLSRVYDVGRQQMAMLWIFLSFMEWLKRRGGGHDRQPVSLVIDELTAMLNPVGASQALIHKDFADLIAVTARSHQLWLTVAFQELDQVEEGIRQTLMQSGTLLFGATSSMTTSLQLAKRFDRYRPHWVKKWTPRYEMFRGEPLGVIDYTTTEYTADEQQLIKSEKYRMLSRFEFFAGTVDGEGRLPQRLRKISIANYQKGIYPNQQLVRQAQQTLSRRDGQSLDAVITQIDQRLDDRQQYDRAGLNEQQRDSVRLQADNAADRRLSDRPPMPKIRKLSRREPV